MYTIKGMFLRAKTRRLGLGMTQKKLSEKMTGITLASIKSYESGHRLPQIDKLPNICEALDCDMEYLFGNCETPHKETESVMQATGLSEKAVDAIVALHNEGESGRHSYRMQVINYLIESGTLFSIADDFYFYGQTRAEWVAACEAWGKTIDAPPTVGSIHLNGNVLNVKHLTKEVEEAGFLATNLGYKEKVARYDMTVRITEFATKFADAYESLPGPKVDLIRID